ncbi:MAG: antibiotic biosynthesis monooxygenase [Actinobacteria bacterium]|nr:MAG: antibiotic biosynthesis monooxygenase [Actinomycetota bacterium]
MYALAVRFDVRDEEADAQFDALARNLVEQIEANEPGTLLYATHTIEGEPLARLFYEVYADEDAFQAHQDAEYVKAFLTARVPLLADRRVERLRPAFAKGLRRG